MLDTVVISGKDVCYGVVFGTLVGVSVFSVIWSKLLLFAFQSMFISICVSRLKIAEFLDSVRRSAPQI